MNNLKKFFQKEPWYFAFVALGFIMKPILEWFVMFYFDGELVENWLSKKF